MTANNQIIDISNTRDLTETQQKVKSDLPQYWTREEVHAILDTVKDASHRMLFTYLWMTGNRVTEALSIKRRDLDFENYLITIRWLKNRKYNARNIPMHPNLKQLLMLYCSTMKYDDKVFDISRQRAWQLCQKYANANPHKFRHSFAVNWLKCGGSLVILSQILGHSDIRITMEYLRIVPIEQGQELLKVSF
jgi:integrase